MKLSKQFKQDLVRKIVSEKTAPAEKILQAKKVAAVYAYFEEAMAPYKDSVNNIPKGFLPQISRFDMYFGEGWSDSVSVDIPEPISVPHIWTQGSTRPDIKIQGDSWKNLFIDLYKERMRLKEYSEKLHRELSNVLAGISTDKQLAGVFPEVIPYIPTGSLNYPVAISAENARKILAEEI
jgi:hypothetical protein